MEPDQYLEMKYREMLDKVRRLSEGLAWLPTKFEPYASPLVQNLWQQAREAIERGELRIP